jgi:hypothetical protein
MKILVQDEMADWVPGRACGKKEAERILEDFESRREKFRALANVVRNLAQPGTPPELRKAAFEAQAAALAEVAPRGRAKPARGMIIQSTPLVRGRLSWKEEVGVAAALLRADPKAEPYAPSLLNRHEARLWAKLSPSRRPKKRIRVRDVVVLPRG